RNSLGPHVPWSRRGSPHGCVRCRSSTLERRRLLHSGRGHPLNHFNRTNPMKFSSTAVLALVSCVTLSACVTRGGQAPLRPASAVEDSIARVNQETYERLQRIAEEE